MGGNGFVFKEKANDGSHSLSAYSVPTLDSVFGVLASPGRCGRCPCSHNADENTETQPVLGRAGIGTKD